MIEFRCNDFRCNDVRCTDVRCDCFRCINVIRNQTCLQINYVANVKKNGYMYQSQYSDTKTLATTPCISEHTHNKKKGHLNDEIH